MTTDAIGIIHLMTDQEKPFPLLRDSVVARMQIVLYSAYHEGSSSRIVEINGSKALGLLNCGCEI